MPLSDEENENGDTALVGVDEMDLNASEDGAITAIPQLNPPTLTWVPDSDPSPPTIDDAKGLLRSWRNKFGVQCTGSPITTRSPSRLAFILAKAWIPMAELRLHIQYMQYTGDQVEDLKEELFTLEFLNESKKISWAGLSDWLIWELRMTKAHFGILADWTTEYTEHPERRDYMKMPERPKVLYYDHLLKAFKGSVREDTVPVQAMLNEIMEYARQVYLPDNYNRITRYVADGAWDELARQILMDKEVVEYVYCGRGDFQDSRKLDMQYAIQKTQERWFRRLKMGQTGIVWELRASADNERKALIESFHEKEAPVVTEPFPRLEGNVFSYV